MKQWITSIFLFLISVYSLTIELYLIRMLWQGEYTTTELQMEFLLRTIAAIICCIILVMGIIQINQKPCVAHMIGLFAGILYSIIAVYQSKLYVGDYAFSFRFIVAMYLVMVGLWIYRKKCIADNH